MIDQEIDTVARTIYGEARGEAHEGMVAVACVIMNRMKAQKRRWGLTPHKVCKKPWQFSCWNKRNPNRPVILSVTQDCPIFKKCLEIAEQAVSGKLEDITDGTTYYHASWMKKAPRW